MKSFVKYALASVVLAAASGAAYADVTSGSSGNGELMLVVRDLSSPTRVFTTGLGLTMDSFLTQAQLTGTPGTATDLRNGLPITGQGSNPTINFTSGALQSFMGVSSALGYEWAVMGSDSLGTSTTANTGNGSVRVITTTETQFSASFLGNVPYTAGLGGNGGMASNMSLFFDENNALLPDAPGSSIENGTYGQTGFGSSAPTLFGTAGNLTDPAANAGVSQRLYMLTSGGSSTSTSRIYQFADLSLSTSGVLTSAVSPGGPEVPLPAAVWLLGSALVGLTTVRRRKSAEVAA
jgi:hypothetical protein